MIKLLDMINEQMNFELQSAYEYKAMQIYADDEEFEGFAHWYGCLLYTSRCV